jgi:hypothetical protein
MRIMTSCPHMGGALQHGSYSGRSLPRYSQIGRSESTSCLFRCGCGYVKDSRDAGHCPLKPSESVRYVPGCACHVARCGAVVVARVPLYRYGHSQKKPKSLPNRSRDAERPRCESHASRVVSAVRYGAAECSALGATVAGVESNHQPLGPSPSVHAPILSRLHFDALPQGPLRPVVVDRDLDPEPLRGGG